MKKTYSAFAGNTLLCCDSLLNIALEIKNHVPTDQNILIFNDQTGQQIDIDVSGSAQDIEARYGETTEVKKVGRPKLGVISREVTLQQKHWDWLDQQSASASSVIRKLIDQELNNPASSSNIMMAKQAVDRFMSAMLGDMPHYEEATRALYQGNKTAFDALIEHYPADLKSYLLKKTESVF